MRGIKLPQYGLTKKTRWKQEERQERWRISTKFVTFILSRMKFATVHRKGKTKEIEKKIIDKTPRDLGPERTTAHIRSEGPTVQLCGDCNVACKWINGEFSLGTKNRDE